jgi:hypothetical protein
MITWGLVYVYLIHALSDACRLVDASFQNPQPGREFPCEQKLQKLQKLPKQDRSDWRAVERGLSDSACSAVDFIKPRLA